MWGRIRRGRRQRRAGSASPAPNQGGTYNYPLQQDPGSLAPFLMDAGWEVGVQIYEGLVDSRPLENGTFVTVPRLAQSWSANEDASVWTFRLRRGVRFQAPVGREVTAEDVVADFRFGADPANESTKAFMYAYLAGTDDNGHAARPADLGVEALDRYTVRFTLKEPFAAFPDTLGNAHAWVWPVDYLRRVGRAGFEERPVGTGPFVLSRWVHGSSVDLVRNPDWWDGASGRPYLDAVHCQVFKSVSAQLLAFQNGLIDYTWVPQGQVAASKSLPQVQSGEWSARTVPTLGIFYVAFNMTDPVVGGERGLPIRQAVDCAVDREALVAAVGDGVHIPQTGLVPPILAGWRETAPAQAYDPARAAQLYAAAGSPPLELVCPQDRLPEAAAAWLQAACASAGISLRVRPMAWEKFAGLNNRGRPPAMSMLGWVAVYPSADEFLYGMFFSELSHFSGTCYSDSDVDRLLTLARSTADVGRHYDLNLRAAREAQADVPVIPLYEWANFRLVNERLGGFNADWGGLVHMWELWVR